MKRFLTYLCLFFLPVALVAVSAEILLRHIPNDYRNKRIYLDKHAADVRVLFLGASHSLIGLNPDYFSENSFNASYVSQTLGIDLDILKKYDQQLVNLKCIVLPISYCTMYEKLSETTESWRIKNYVLYYQMDISKQMTDHSEVLGNKLWFNLYRLMNYYAPLLSH